MCSFSVSAMTSRAPGNVVLEPEFATAAKYLRSEDGGLSRLLEATSLFDVKISRRRDLDLLLRAVCETPAHISAAM